MSGLHLPVPYPPIFPFPPPPRPQETSILGCSVRVPGCGGLSETKEKYKHLSVCERDLKKIETQWKVKKIGQFRPYQEPGEIKKEAMDSL